jgi:transposase
VLRKRFIEGEDRNQSTLFPERLDDYIAEGNPVRVIDVFVDELDLWRLGVERVEPKVMGRPAYHPSMLLKLYIYAYLNRDQSSRRIEREFQRNVELMWPTGRLMPNHKTIAGFRKGNSQSIRGACRDFVVLCRRLNLFTQALVVIDGSKFTAVNDRDTNFTRTHHALTDIDSGYHCNEVLGTRTISLHAGREFAEGCDRGPPDSARPVLPGFQGNVQSGHNGRKPVTGKNEKRAGLIEGLETVTGNV